MIEIPYHPKHTENMERSGNGEHPPCVVCGRGIKAKAPAMVHMFWATHLVTEKEAGEILAREGDGGDMYFYPIGPDCLRQHPELRPYTRKAQGLADIEPERLGY